MQINQLHTIYKSKDRKRVGRGGKRGTFSGRGSKGQKSRAGHRIRPGFRGGDNPIWKLFPKQRGAGGKTEIKHALSRMHYAKPAIVNLDVLEKKFKDGEKVTAKALIRKNIIKTAKKGIKILGAGGLKKKLSFGRGFKFSKLAKESVEKTGGEIDAD